MLHLICCIWAMVLFFFFRQQYFYFSIFGAIISCCRTLDGIPLENCPKNHSQKKTKKKNEKCVPNKLNVNIFCSLYHFQYFMHDTNNQTCSRPFEIAFNSSTSTYCAFGSVWICCVFSKHIPFCMFNNFILIKFCIYLFAHREWRN